jgi:O-antigen/teichoic acid export membrane protein
MMLKCVLILLPLFTVLLLFPEQIVKISYTETYLSAVPALKVLLVGMFVYAVFNIPLTLMWSQHEEDFPMILSFAVLVLDGVLLYCLVPKYGLLGASFSTTISAFTLLFLSYAKVKKMRNFNARSNSL